MSLGIVAFPGSGAVTATLTDTINGANSGTFTLPGSRTLVVLCFAAQLSAGQATSCTIGGHAATEIVTNGVAGNSCSMWAAVVDPTDPDTWSITASVFSARSTAYFYRLTADRINATATAASSATNPTADLNVPAYSTYLGCAQAQGAAPPGASWAGLALDSKQTLSQHTTTCAHENYSAAASSQTATCTFSGSTGSAGVFAVFSS